MEIALSTAWNYYKDPEILLDEIKCAGFDKIELSFHFNTKAVSLLKKLIKKHGLSVLTIHNFCPFPLEEYRGFPSPDFYSLSALDLEERKLALKFTERTLETGYEFGAKVVILHAGKVENIMNKTVYFFNLKQNNYDNFKSEIKNYLNLRKQKIDKHLSVLKFSLESLVKKAEKLDLKIGLEARYYLHEIPELEELEDILVCFSCPYLGYCHDAGHTHVKECLEVYAQKDYLKRLCNYLVCIHYHDACGIDDHKPIGKGELDFSIFKNYAGCINVLEVHSPASVKEIHESKQLLLKQLKADLFSGQEDPAKVK